MDSHHTANPFSHPQHSALYPNDRRYHEQEPPVPHQHHQYRPSPAAPFLYHVYPAQGIERESEVFHLSHYSYSTPGGPPDGLPTPPPQFPQPPEKLPLPEHSLPRPHNDDRRDAFSGSNFPPPPPPEQQQQQFQSHDVSYQPPPDHNLSRKPYERGGKSNRVSQACDRCRQLKTKCDGTESCKNCKAAHIDCEYTFPLKRVRLDDAQTLLLDKIAQLKTILETGLGSFQERLDNLERSNASSLPHKSPQLVCQPIGDAKKAQADFVNARMKENEGLNDNSTSTGRILLWPSIKNMKLMQRMLERENLQPGNFPLCVEERREPPAYFDIEPDFSKETVMMHIKACAFVLRLHPIISPVTLKIYASQLLKQTAGRAAKTSDSSGCSTASATSTGKRKRQQNNAVDTPSSRGAGFAVLERSIENAVTLAALALGKLSSSPLESDPSTPKDLSSERFPGLEYLSLATSIVGNQDGCKKIQHIQANVLIALYYGQTGYVIKSLKYISNAVWALKMHRDHLLRLQIHGWEVDHQDSKDYELLVTLWTCLQLESDIVVELSLPQSDIISFEETMPYPDMSHSDFGEFVDTGFLAQRYIQKARSAIVMTLYSETFCPEDVNKLLKAAIQVRAPIRIEPKSDVSWLHPSHKFNEGDPPQQDILAAQLRAKYWECQVLRTRPFLKMILDFSCQLEDGLTQSSCTFKLGSYDELDPAIIDHAKEGINALVESTRTFCKCDANRLPLGNIFSTAILQWGNLVVLVACYRDPFLCDLVDQTTLLSLFEPAISWIGKVAQPSSSLAVAVRILKELHEDIQLVEQYQGLK